MNIDPWIFSFSAVTVIATIWMGFRSAKKSKTASDFFVAGRSVSVGWNASAISGEYLSAASFMGVAGMVMSSGYDALWYPVCYACGYLFLLLFIAGPLRRFGAYTIPDFAEGRFDSPVFRKIAVVFVLFIGFFYTMPQMKGAGTTLAYIFPGLPYWVGVVLVGAVITLNVALGGMKGITLVQAFQYWIKMFAISVPIFVLMSVYGHYGKQLGVNGDIPQTAQKHWVDPENFPNEFKKLSGTVSYPSTAGEVRSKAASFGLGRVPIPSPHPAIPLIVLVGHYMNGMPNLGDTRIQFYEHTISPDATIDTSQSPLPKELSADTIKKYYEAVFASKGLTIIEVSGNAVALLPTASLAKYVAPADATLHSPVGSLPDRSKPVTGSIVISTSMTLPVVDGWTMIEPPSSVAQVEQRLRELVGQGRSWRNIGDAKLISVLMELSEYEGRRVMAHTNLNLVRMLGNMTVDQTNRVGAAAQLRGFLASKDVSLLETGAGGILAVQRSQEAGYRAALESESDSQLFRAPLPAKAPADATWLSPFGPLTTKAAKATAAAMDKAPAATLPLAAGLTSDQRLTVHLDSPTPAQALGVYGELTGRQLAPRTNSIPERVDDLLGGALTKLKLLSTAPVPDNGVRFHNDGSFTVGEVKSAIEGNLRTNGLALVAVGEKAFKVEAAISSPGKAWLANHEKPLALLYTYSLIIALVCGTAGLPHILVRFYTNPDGVAAKRTTMWVMILIGVFYVFPPVFGVLGRNLMPELYNGIGAKGTDKVVLELPRILNEQGSGGEKEKGGNGADGRGGEISSAPLPLGSSAEAPATSASKGIPWGSILSGITCAGAFAAFMSTFSGLLVSMTGALAHDVYGRMLKPNATAEERTRMFKFGAVLLGGVAIVLGSFVEALEINFMVGQAFAIAAASYFPLLFMAVWWRKLTMRGAAVGMLAGGVAALLAVTLTNLSTLSLDPGPMGKVFAVFKPLNDFWAEHPLLRILCEQPAIWAVPLAIGLMVIVSKLTQATVPADIRMKMLVLHAPEKLGLKQEYIQEHQAGH